MRLKRRLARFVVFCFMLLCMWCISIMPVQALNAVALYLFAACFVLLMVLIGLTLKRRHLLFVGLLFLAAKACFAQDASFCEESFNSSVAEGRWCIYLRTTERYGTDVCQGMVSFNPTKSTNEETRQELVNKADAIVQAYNDLDKVKQASVNANCKLLSAEDRDAKIETRVQKLHSNSGPICCAWAMQTLNQIYNSQFAERQVQTVPMMLANDKTQCWPCDVIYLLIVLVNTMAFNSAPIMSKVGLFFIKWMFVFWLAVKVGMLFFNYGADKKAYSGTKFLQELFIRIICVFLAAFILTDTAAKYDATKTTTTTFSKDDKTALGQVYNHIFNPVFQMISSLGIVTAETLLEGKASFYGSVSEAVRNSTHYSVRVYASALEKIDYCKDSARITMNPIYQHLSQPDVLLNSGLKLDDPNQLIGDDLATSILCLSQLSFRGTAPIASVGSIFISHAIKNSVPLRVLPGHLPLMPQIFYGVLLNVICWVIGIVVAFKLIDIMLRVALVIILAPIFIAVAPFPLSRGYAVKGLKFFIAALMGFVEVALAVGLIVPFFYEAIGGSDKEALIDAMVAPSGVDYVPNLYEQFTADGFKVLLYILGVAWLSKNLFGGVHAVFQKIFGLAAVGKMAGKSTFDATQTSIRAAIGKTYDFGKKVGRSSAPFKTGFMKHMEGGNVERLGSAVGSSFGKMSGHASKAARYFYNKAKGTEVGQAAVAAKNKTAAAFKWTGKALDKAGYVVGKGLQKQGGNVIKSGGKMCGAGYGLGSIIGVPMMLGGAAMWAGGTTARVAGKTAAFVGKTAATMAKRLPAYAKNQVRKGVDQFFHPKEK